MALDKMLESAGKSYLRGLPLVGGMFDTSEQDTLDAMEKAKAAYEGLTLPSYSQYAPESAQYSTIADPTELRNLQLGYLTKLSGLGDTGLSAEDEASFNRANQVANAQAQAQTKGAIANAASRGVLGGGLEFAMRQQGAQDAAQRAANANMEKAAQTARQRALYTQAYGQAVGGVRGQDFQQGSANADIINRFNMYNTGERNRAQQLNNSYKQQSYADALARAGGIAGGYQGMAKGYAAQNAADQSTKNAQLGAIAKFGGAMVGAPTQLVANGGGSWPTEPLPRDQWAEPVDLTGGPGNEEEWKPYGGSSGYSGGGYYA